MAQYNNPLAELKFPKGIFQEFFEISVFSIL
jgi:hypothetical protein